MSNNALAVQLPRVLGARDVALLYTIAIVSLQWLTTAAQMGPASLLLWPLALVVFLVPSGLAVMELSSRYDGEGGPLSPWRRAVKTVGGRFRGSTGFERAVGVFSSLSFR
jgi:amino acid transporter